MHLHLFLQVRCVVYKVQCAVCSLPQINIQQLKKNKFLFIQFKFFSFKHAYKWVKRRITYNLANYLTELFVRNILGKMIVLRNQCINLCPEQFILGQIPIPCQELCSQWPKCSQLQHQVFGEFKFKLQLNTKNFSGLVREKGLVLTFTWSNVT